MRRELIIGASGLVGSYLFQCAKQSQAVVRGTYHRCPLGGLEFLDLRDEHSVGRMLLEFEPDVIYLPAAISHVDWIENHAAESRIVNVEAPFRLIQHLKNSGTLLVFYSTDYIFDGMNGPYTENDPPNPVCEYGREKLAVEAMIRTHLRNWLVLRTTIAYGWELQKKNFVHRCILTLQAGNSISVPVDQIGNPTYVWDIALASRELVDKGARGVFNICGSVRSSRYDFALEIARVFHLPSDKIIPVATRNLAGKARRPLDAGMVVQKANDVLTVPLRGYPEALVSMRSEEPFPTWPRTTN
jgi:dTDP-4-dehydrorhamnose reductase